MMIVITTLQFQLEKAGRSVNLDFQTVLGILRHGIMEGFSQKTNLVVTEVTYVFLIKPKLCVFSMH